MTRITLISASHAPDILAANLARSPDVLSGALPLSVIQGAASASLAYNGALAQTEAEIAIFAHHDVYLPKGWLDLFQARLMALPPDWAVFGTFGIGRDGAHLGPVWSSSLGQIVGRVPLVPTPVQSLDELLIVLRTSAQLRFDAALPGWHLYGTDIVQTALAAGQGAYAGALPCIHNDQSHLALGADFDTAYRFMQRKWARALPIRTPITKISASGLHRLRDRWRARRAAPILKAMATGTDHDPARLAALCGWSDLSAST